MVAPVLASGSLSRLNSIKATSVYEAILNELGATGTIVPLGDPAYRTAPTTWRSAAGVSGLESAVWTASEAIEAFDTPPTRQGICPIITLNGTDEFFTSPDAAYWTRDDDGGANGFSAGLWHKLPSQGGGQKFISKWDGDNSVEWSFEYISNRVLRVFLKDDSANKTPRRDADAGLVADVWHQVVMTYDGGGGATAAAGIKLYSDGVLVASTGTEQALYVGMEDTAASLYIVARQLATPDLLMNGPLAGGPCGPFFTHSELTAAQVKNIYRHGKAALAL
jgi:hypothetical protein